MIGDTETTGHLWYLLRSNRPIVAIYYSNAPHRVSLFVEFALLAPNVRPIRYTDRIEELFTGDNELTVFTGCTGDDEVALIDALEHDLRWPEIRTAPVVVFLRAGGEGSAALRQRAFTVASHLQGAVYIPDVEDDEEEHAP